MKLRNIIENIDKSESNSEWHTVGVTNVKRNDGNVLTMDLRKDLIVPFNLQK